MILENIIRPDSVLCNVAARSKKHCLEILSELLTRPNPDIANEEAFVKLIERERLGCTSLDKGIAFPHCRVNGIKKSSAALIKLLEPVDFDSIDGEDVDLVFGLMVPSELDEADRADIESIAHAIVWQKSAATVRDRVVSAAEHKTDVRRKTADYRKWTFRIRKKRRTQCS
jgi:PTS system nitrogen regulatory IIA component